MINIQHLAKDSEGKGTTLVVDVGNTHTVVAIFSGEKVVEYWRMTTNHPTTSDEVYIRLYSLMGENCSIKKHEITHVGLCTVVPVLERIWIKALDFFIKKPIVVVSHNNCLGLGINYQTPSLLGTDRIANVIAMVALGYENGIVVDLGTATTFEVIKGKRFLGGVILPGISSGMDVLTQKAARLMPVSLEWTNTVIADNTDDAIRAGLLHGFLGQLKYMIEAMKKESGLTDVEVIATGGWSTMLGEKINLINKFDPYLTLRGIRLVALNGEVREDIIDDRGE